MASLGDAVHVKTKDLKDFCASTIQMKMYNYHMWKLFVPNDNMPSTGENKTTFLMEFVK